MNQQRPQATDEFHQVVPTGTWLEPVYLMISSYRSASGLALTITDDLEHWHAQLSRLMPYVHLWNGDAWTDVLLSGPHQGDGCDCAFYLRLARLCRRSPDGDALRTEATTKRIALMDLLVKDGKALHGQNGQDCRVPYSELNKAAQEYFAAAQAAWMS